MSSKITLQYPTSFSEGSTSKEHVHFTECFKSSIGWNSSVKVCLYVPGDESSVYSASCPKLVRFDSGSPVTIMRTSAI